MARGARAAWALAVRASRLPAADTQSPQAVVPAEGQGDAGEGGGAGEDGAGEGGADDGDDGDADERDADEIVLTLTNAQILALTA